MSTRNICFLWRNKQNLIVTKYPPYLFHCFSLSSKVLAQNVLYDHNCFEMYHATFYISSLYFIKLNKNIHMLIYILGVKILAHIQC